ncbi:MAG: hypothetical protein M3Z25_13960 [Actinomycetota bacterium]|nr:hypothetical protein [Actinomycetota bacterium]
MSRWIYDTGMDEWAALFTGYAKSAYRLEGRQVYRNPDDDAAVARFLAGEPFDPDDLSWVLPKLRAQVAAGRTKTVVRVVVEPPTDYTRWELTFYPHVNAAGQDTRIIAVPEGEWPVGLPRHDYWLFDEHDVWRMHYNADLTFHGAELIEDEAAIAQHLVWRDLALALAEPLKDYLAARRGV